nr:hypothetical protein [Tanacetum cinerariifolium]
MMSFLSAVVTSCYHTTNNQQRNPSNPRQQATINDGRVTLQPIQGRQISFAMGTTRTYTPGTSRSNSRKQRTVICYNYKREGHMSKQCTKPKRKMDDLWFKDKVLLVQVQANGQILHENELAFLVDPGIAKGQATQTEQGLIIAALKDELRKLKGKAVVDNTVTTHTIDPEMLKVDVEPIAFRLLNNRTVHSDFLRLTQKQAAILREVVEQEKSQNPLNNSLDHACKYTKRIQELLIIIRQTCSIINNSSDKLVAVTPKNKDKRVRFTEPETSSRNTNTKTASSSNLVSNKPMLSSTGVKPSTSASGSQPSGNTKKDRIQ